MKHILVLALFVTSSFAGNTIYFPSFELINVHDDYNYSVARVLKGYIDENGSYELIIPSQEDISETSTTKGYVQKQALEGNHPNFMLANLNRIGEMLFIQVSLYESTSGNLLWSKKYKAKSPEDLDPIMSRVARKIEDPNTTNEADIYSVTTQEQKKLKKIKTQNSFGITVGSAVPINSVFSDDPFIAGFGAYWAYDARTILFELSTQVNAMGNHTFVMGSINGALPFSPENNTAYITAGVGVGAATAEESYSSDNLYLEKSASGTGMILSGGIGYLFNRTSNVNLKVELKYFASLFKMDDIDRTSPHGVLFNVGLAFGN